MLIRYNLVRYVLLPRRQHFRFRKPLAAKPLANVNPQQFGELALSQSAVASAGPTLSPATWLTLQAGS